MTLSQQIVLALVGIICLTLFAAAVVLGVIAYAELFLRDIDAELDCLGDTYLVTYRTDTIEGGSDDCGRVEILHRNVAIDYQIINS